MIIGCEKFSLKVSFNSILLQPPECLFRISLQDPCKLPKAYRRHDNKRSKCTGIKKGSQVSRDARKILNTIESSEVGKYVIELFTSYLL